VDIANPIRRALIRGAPNPSKASKDIFEGKGGHLKAPGKLSAIASCSDLDPAIKSLSRQKRVSFIFW